MDWWTLAFSAVAAVTGTVMTVIEVRRWRAERRSQWASAVWELRSVQEDEGLTLVVGTLRNIGAAAMYFLDVQGRGCEVFLLDDEGGTQTATPFGQVYKVGSETGDTLRVMFRSPCTEINEAWMLISWHPAQGGGLHLAWYPVLTSGPLLLVWKRSCEQTHTSRWQRLRPRPWRAPEFVVGPAGRWKLYVPPRRVQALSRQQIDLEAHYAPPQPLPPQPPQ